MGEQSSRTKVQDGLRFSITNFLDSSQLDRVIETWSTFKFANLHLIENSGLEDQSSLIQTFIETNLTSKASTGQKFLFGKLKDQPRLTRPTTLHLASL